MSMRLGRETNSITNWMLSTTKGAPEPVVGMGATILMWTDRHAATIVKVTPCTIHVKRDKAIRVDGGGMTEMQKYRYEFLAVLNGAIIMVLEIVGARIIAPHFGSSIYVWTAVIP